VTIFSVRGKEGSLADEVTATRAWCRRARVVGWMLPFFGALSATRANAQVVAPEFGFGEALASGNFNGVKEGGDAEQAGDELIVGSPFEPGPGGVLGAGTTYVYVKNGSPIWSSPTLSGQFQPSGWTTFWFDQSYFAASDGGPEQDDRFGGAFAVGDFNGDGKKDLAIGVPGEDLGSRVNAGCVHILFGANNTGTLWPFKEKAYLTRESAFGSLPVSNLPAADDLFGWSLAAGDFNGDGTDDLAVGAPGVRVGTNTAAGAVFVFHTSPTLPPSNATFPRTSEYTFYEGGTYAGTSTGPAAPS